MADIGVPVEKHHHEVAPSQHELGMKFGTLLEATDNMLTLQVCCSQVAHAYGLSATFMPKPIAGDNGSGMRSGLYGKMASRYLLTVAMQIYQKQHFTTLVVSSMLKRLTHSQTRQQTATSV